MNKNIIKWPLAVLIVFTTITYIGCEQKNDKAEQPQNAKVTADTTSLAVKSEEPNDTVVVAKIIIPEMIGTWSGIFDGRSSTLRITEQIDSSFSGKITINYRQVTNQEVKGILNPRTGEIIMTDQLHSRYQGKYKGELSTNNNNFSGTFTMDNDGTKYSFNLNRK
jgi:ribosomal protein S19